MSDFNAPEIPVKLKKPGEYEWATFISDRFPRFKVHRTVGHAHAALTNRRSYYGNRLTADVALYRMQEGNWVPEFALAEGTTITHFPWQEPPPDPAIQRKKQTHDNINSWLSSVISSVERELTGEVQRQAVAELKAVKAKVLRLIQDS